MKNLRFIVELAVYVVGYGLLTDLVSPVLVGNGHAGVWWLVLGIYIVLGWAITVWKAKRTTGKANIVPGTLAFILVGILVVLVDPSLRPRLEARGLGWLWLVSAAACFGWGAIQFVRLRREDREERQSREAGGPLI